MKQLTNEQALKKEKLLNEVTDAESALNSEIDDFNSEVERLFTAAVEPKRKALNQKIAELKEFCDQVAGEASDHFNEQDEDWQDGDEGSKYNQWKEGFEAATDIADIEIEKPDEIENVEVDLLGVDSLSDEFDG